MGPTVTSVSLDTMATCLPCRMASMPCFAPAPGNACGFDDDVEGQVHHLHGVGEDDIFALFYGFGCLLRGVA